MKRASRLMLSPTLSLLEGIRSRTVIAALAAGLFLATATALPTSNAQAAPGGSAARAGATTFASKADKLPSNPPVPFLPLGASLPPSSTVCQGATIAVPIDVAPIGGAIGMDFLIEFDPSKIQPTNVVTSAITAGCRIDWNVVGIGLDQLSIAISCLTPRSGSGTVAYVYLQGVAASGSSPLHWLAANLDEQPITATADGSVTIGSGSSTLLMATVIGGSGGIVNLPLLGNLAPNSIGINAEVHWDPAVLTGISASISASLPGDCQFDVNIPSAGVALVAIACQTPLSGPQHLANIKVQVVGGVGTQTSLDLVAGTVNEVDACLEDGLFTAVSGAIVSVPISSNVCQGADLVVPIDVSPATGVVGMDFVLQYNPLVVLPTNVVLGPLTAGHTCAMNWNIPAAGQLAIAISCQSALSGSGTVANVIFQGIAAAPASTPLTWLQHDLNEGQISSSHQNGAINVVSGGSTLSMPPLVLGGSGGVLDIPLSGDLALGSIGINTVVTWDPAVLTAISVALGPNLPPTWTIDSDLSTPGQASISVFGTIPISGPQVLALIKFNVIGLPNAVSPLNILSGAVNEINACLDDGLFRAVSGALVSVPPVSCVCVGSQVAVPITVSPADGVEGMDFVLQYNPALFLPVNVTLGGLTSGGCSLNWNIPVAGQVAIGISCLGPLSGSGTAAIVYFQGVGTPPAVSPLTWLLHDLNEGQIPSSSQDGQLCLSSSTATLSMPADANGTSGSTVQVPLTGNLPAGTIGINAVVQWDPSVLTGVTVTLAPGLPGDWGIDFELTPGRASISVFGTTAISGNQTLAYIDFTVIGPAGSNTALDVTFGEVNEVPACLDDGTFYVCSSCDDGNACTADSCVMGQCVNTALPVGTTCRAAAGSCDVAETCDGLGNPCPADVFVAATTSCRASAGPCDVAESCTGTNAACPIDAVAAATTICRPSAGICDVAESCNGSAVTCPSDAFVSATMSCRASAGPCDVAESCTGTSAACPSDAVASATTICRPSAGICDVAESCNGSAVTCPSDAFVSATTSCRASAGPCDVAESCTGTSAACPGDAVASATTICRPSAGICDVAESCNGSAVTCPSDAFVSATTSCRASAGPCDVAESCTGTSAACPGDAVASATTICRPSAGICDVAESCNGSAVTCPSDAFVSATTSCRASAGPCDVAESCTGTSAACPSDAVASATTICRPSAGICDVAESCNGSAVTCPSDAFVSATTSCRASAGPCDVAESCTGTSAACPGDAVASATTICRPSAGICDVAESCNGSAVTCPSDAFVSATTSCRASAGPCDVAESCTGTSAACPGDAVASATTICRPSAGICDVAESCNGSAVTCPSDAFVSATTSCRASAGPCDVAESCTGTSAACPGDAVASATTICRPSAGICDVAESCNGSAVTCPTDAFVSATTSCRASAGPCDVAESCTGTSAACPGDAVASATTICRPSAGICDVAESCNGSAVTCPTDAFVSATTVCRPAAGLCDLAESCTGSGATCPTDVFPPANTPCDDGSACTSPDLCDGSGQCVGTTAPRPAVINNSVRVNKSPVQATVTWNDAPGPYNLYRGGNGPTPSWQYNQSCLATTVGGSSVQDTENPPIGRFFYYLVTRASACDESSLGNDSAAAERPNTNPCPLPSPDADSDGILDASDNCWAVSNGNQADPDIDGVGTACDNCPAVWNPGQENLDGDSPGDACDPDMDGDLVANNVDNCPTVYNPDQADSNQNGVGDACEPGSRGSQEADRRRRI